MKVDLVPWVLTAGAAIAVSAPGPRPPAPGAMTSTRLVVSRRAAAEDLQTWARRVTEVHPSLRSVEAAEAVHAQVDGLVDALPPVVDCTWLHARWSAVAASLHDSHTTINAPAELSEHPPLPITVDGEELCLNRDVRGVKAGSCFVSFAGVPAAAAVRWIVATAPHETEDGWRIQAPRLLPFALTALAVPPGSEAVVRTSDDKRSSFQLPDWDEFEPPPAKNAIDLGVDERGIAILVLRTFDGREEAFFEEAFSRVFRALAEGNARGLIIDLRGNDGGSTRVAEMLLDRLTTSDYRMMGEKRWRVSETMQNHLRDEGSTGRYLDETPGMEMLGRVPMQSPTAYPHLFAGPVFFLSDRNTRSTAMMLLDAVQTYKLAGILGESPASPPNYFGEVYRYSEGHCGFSVGISTAAFVRASGDPLDSSRVKPHVPLSTFRVRDSKPDVAVVEATRLIERWLARESSGSE